VAKKVQAMKLGLFLLSENFHANPHAAILNDVELAAYAEELGFDEVWFAEHHFNSFSVIPNPSLIMAYVAAKTIKIRIGSAAFLAPFYHPIRLAEEIATLDNLSNGRINAGFAKGGFTLDMEYFSKSPEHLRTQLFRNVERVATVLHENKELYPKPLQKKIPIYIATFSTKETIEFAARNGYGLMFSQGATLEECEQACSVYKELAGYAPEVVLMRVFYIATTYREAYENAVVATDHFVKSMRSLNAYKTQPAFQKENYKALLAQRYDFFDAKKFMDASIIGTVEESIENILNIKRRIGNLHLVLKVASFNAQETRKVLKLFSQEIKPHI
jgi:alkanesulfonate monooxygenase SsuD/methylene tetrahydromethanopterin reductase-like flavin-dependent oxidoreductase (luciferase family)